MGNIIGVVVPFIYGVSYTFNPAVDERTYQFRREGKHRSGDER